MVMYKMINDMCQFWEWNNELSALEHMNSSYVQGIGGTERYSFGCYIFLQLHFQKAVSCKTSKTGVIHFGWIIFFCQ
jgi:hypothetical protein